MVESANVASSHPVRQTLVQIACRRRLRDFPRSLRAAPRSSVLDSTQGARQALESSQDRGRLEQGSFQLRARLRDDPRFARGQRCRRRARRARVRAPASATVLESTHPSACRAASRRQRSTLEVAEEQSVLSHELVQRAAIFAGQARCVSDVSARPGEQAFEVVSLELG
jgi:hypothetical protein